MTNTTTVQCPHCKSNVIPRIWYYSPPFGAWRFVKWQHICTVCGRTMYETGGGIRPGMTIFTVLCLLPIIYFAFAMKFGVDSVGGALNLFLLLIEYLPTLIVAWIIYKYVKKNKKPKGMPSENPDKGNNNSSTGNIDSDNSGKTIDIYALSKLAELYEKGALTEEEYRTQKKKLFSQ